MLETASISVSHPPPFIDSTALFLPSDIFAGDAGRLRALTLSGVLMPPEGCVAFAHLRALDWRNEFTELSRDDVLSLLAGLPALETLRLLTNRFKWEQDYIDSPVAHKLRNLHIDAISVDGLFFCLRDLGIERFAYDAGSLDPGSQDPLQEFVVD